MSIMITGLSSLDPIEFNFIHNGFSAGKLAGDFPDYRQGPDNEEMAAIAYNNDGPAGFATFYHAGSPERVWLDLLWVKPDCRRKSIGTHLLAAVLAYGERYGLAIEFGTLSSNLVMQKLALSFGLKPFTVGYRKEPIAA
jgi:GNAT superfamily N-acetyltransferase